MVVRKRKLHETLHINQVNNGETCFCFSLPRTFIFASHHGSVELTNTTRKSDVNNTIHLLGKLKKKKKEIVWILEKKKTNNPRTTGVFWWC